MNKNQKIVIFSAAGVILLGLIALIIILIVNNSEQTEEVNKALAEVENLKLEKEQLELTNEFNMLNADFSQYEDQQIYLKNDSLVQKYNEARLKVEGLIAELDKERKANKVSAS